MMKPTFITKTQAQISSAAGCLLLCLSLFGNALAQNTSPLLSHFDLYEQNRRQGIANYITEDFLLTSYFLIQAKTQSQAEMDFAYPHLQHLLAALAKALDTETGEISRLNRDYIAILLALSTGQTQIPQTNSATQRELKQILAASGIVRSPLWGIDMDYSQFKPRGPYTKTPQTQQYFRTYRYASSVLFTIQASRATGVNDTLADRYVQQALQLSQLLADNNQANNAYQALNGLFDWLLGDSDDLTSHELLAAIYQQPQLIGQPQQLRQQLLSYAQNNQRQPRIIATQITASALEPGLTVADVATGWRLLPARYNPSAAILQQLVFDKVGAYQAKCEHCPLPFTAANINGKWVKGWPHAQEIMALLGSELAQQQLRRSGNQDYHAYPQAWQNAKTELSNAQGLAALQFLLVRQWLTGKHAIAESRRLNSMLVFWTWQRYLHVLYEKQPYTLNGKSLVIEPPRQAGAWLAPATTLYQALTTLVASHQRHAPHPAWQAFAELLERCLLIAWRIEQQGSIINNDEAFLNELDRSLRDIVGITDLPIVVDVHTNPATNEVLQEAVGFIQPIWQNHGPKQRARGSLSTHYEFKQSLSNRLDNSQWRQRLRRQTKQ